jgi:hypothetical protein
MRVELSFLIFACTDRTAKSCIHRFNVKIAQVKKTVPISANISPKAKELLYWFARSLVDKGQDPPIGRVLTAMILDFEEMGNWVEIEDTIRDDLKRQAEERRRKDRDRKRRIK